MGKKENDYHSVRPFYPVYSLKCLVSMVFMILWSGLEPSSSLRLRRAMDLLAVGYMCSLKYE